MIPLKSPAEASAARSAYRRLNMPQPAEVRADTSGRPLAVRKAGQWLRVERILDRYRVDDRWWEAAPISRMYCEVLLTGDHVVTVFRDLVANTWWTQRK